LGREFGLAELLQYVRHIDLFRRDDQQQKELQQALPYPGEFFIDAHSSAQRKLPLYEKVSGCPKGIKKKNGIDLDSDISIREIREIHGKIFAKRNDPDGLQRNKRIDKNR
jgi:hypothetical protein